MTLAIIEMRLKVFPQYLEYRIDQNTNKLLDRANFWTFFHKHGIVLLDNNPEHLLSFNEWLYYNNYSNLIL